MTTVLGVYGNHDAGASLVRDGELVAAAGEERFNRVKHYGSRPAEAVEYCLDAGDITLADVDAVAIASDRYDREYKELFGRDHPTVRRLTRDQGWRDDAGEGDGFVAELSEAPAETLKQTVDDSLKTAYGTMFGGRKDEIPDTHLFDFDLPEETPIYLVDHHESHAASAYYSCGAEDALVLTLDGRGDGLSGTLWRGRDGDLENLRAWGKEGSLGWFYGTVTEALGFWPNNGEGKVMGLASYAEPDTEVMERLRSILPVYQDGELVKPYEFGEPSCLQYMDSNIWSYDDEDVAYVESLVETHGREVVAASAQRLTELQVLNIVEPWLERTGVDRLATAGGIFLNVTVNQRILEADLGLDDYFIFPAAGDGGLPTGAAINAYKSHDPSFSPTRLTNAYFGTDISEEVEPVLRGRNLAFEKFDDPAALADHAAELVADGHLLAWCQGRMEYGPRALGNRSIIADPTDPDAVDRVNKTVKFREPWRPFAPSVLEEAATEYFENITYDPFMITSCDVRPEKHDEVPAITHVDGTARPQVVRKSVNERYWQLIDAFGAKTGTPVVLNTSYNLSGEPIVNTARDAIKTFYDSGLDVLVVGDYVLKKETVTGRTAAPEGRAVSYE